MGKFTHCIECESEIPPKRQARNARYCKSSCQKRAAARRADDRALDSQAEAPESPFARELEQERADKAAHIAEMEAKEPKKPKKRGNQSWKRAENRFRRDHFAVPGLQDGRHASHPDKYFRFITKSRLDERLQQGWQYATHNMFPGFTQQDIVGSSTGATSRIQRNEMFLMWCPLRWRDDYEEYVELMNEAQEREIEENAAQANLTPRPGHFGKGRLGITRKLQEKYRQEHGVD